MSKEVEGITGGRPLKVQGRSSTQSGTEVKSKEEEVKKNEGGDGMNLRKQVHKGLEVSCNVEHFWDMSVHRQIKCMKSYVFLSPKIGKVDQCWPKVAVFCKTKGPCWSKSDRLHSVAFLC